MKHQGTGPRFLFALAALPALLLARPAVAEDWYNWRGPEQTGVSREVDLPEKWSPKVVGKDNLIWKAPIGGRSTPLVMNGHVYLINRVGDLGLNEQERVMCFDADSGKVIWEHKFNVWHTQIVSARLGWTNLAGDPETGNVYAHGTQGMLICFNKDGKVLWEHSLTEEYGRISGYGGRVTSPVVDGDLVIIGMLNASWGDQARGGNRFVAFDKKTGSVVWWSWTGVQPRFTYFSVPVVGVINGERVLVSGGSGGDVNAFRVRTGEKLWTVSIAEGAINCSPVIDGNLVYIGHGEDNAGTNLQGAVVCIDGSKVKNGKAEIVWKVPGIKAKFASPIIHEGRLYITDEVATLYCLDAKTGKHLWGKDGFNYGKDCKGSPVWADGKIYVAEVNSRFHILQPSEKSCKELSKPVFFRGPEGVSVEINGSPAVANGKVYFCTSEEMYCIGKPNHKAQAGAIPPGPKEAAAGTEIGHLQVIPADVVLHPGESATFKVRAFDEHGRFIKEVKAKYSLAPMPVPPPIPNAPPPPPGPKPPDLKGEITEDGKLTIDAKVPSQFGLVVAEFEKLRGAARIRVVPSYPYTQTFAMVPENRSPAGWVNTQGKFVTVKLPDGKNALKKTANNASPLVARANAFIGRPTDTNYTIQADVMGGIANVAAGGTPEGRKVNGDMPDLGIVANRYTLALEGNHQRLNLSTWVDLPRIEKNLEYKWEAKKWYTLKLTVELKDDKAIIRGKVWPRGEKEPEKWSIEAEDPIPNREGCPALYAYATGIKQGSDGAEGFFQNVKITPNKKAEK